MTTTALYPPATQARIDARRRAAEKRIAIYFLNQELERIELLKLRSDLTDEQKLEAARIGRIEFKSAGATRKR